MLNVIQMLLPDYFTPLKHYLGHNQNFPTQLVQRSGMQQNINKTPPVSLVCSIFESEGFAQYF